MIPKRKSLELDHVWDGLLDWHKRQKRDRDREFQRNAWLAANALVNAAVAGFMRGILIAIGILALLYVLAQFGHH
jgi:hypothetical protein